MSKTLFNIPILNNEKLFKWFTIEFQRGKTKNGPKHVIFRTLSDTCDGVFCENI